MSDLQGRAAEDAAALVSRFDAEIQAFVEQLIGRFHDENRELRALLVKARMDLEAARADLATEREHLETLRDDADRMSREFDRTLDEMRREHAATLAEQTAACTALPLDELLTIFNAMKKAETGPDLLGAMIDGLVREFSRVALFHLEGTRLVAAERHGFTDEDTSKPIRLPANSLLTRAVSTGRLEGLMPGADGEPDTSLPFGGTPSCALAIPILVHGKTEAVIYADDSDNVEFATSVPQVRMKFAELLQQHAMLVLMKLSVERKRSRDRKVLEQKKMPVDLRTFAATLVAELEYAYTMAEDAGRNRLECQKHLKDALQKTRRRYAQSAANDPGAAGLLDEQLAVTLAARRDSSFGRDLEALLIAHTTERA